MVDECVIPPNRDLSRVVDFAIAAMERPQKLLPIPKYTVAIIYHLPSSDGLRTVCGAPAHPADMLVDDRTTVCPDCAEALGYDEERKPHYSGGLACGVTPDWTPVLDGVAI